MCTKLYAILRLLGFGEGESFLNFSFIHAADIHLDSPLKGLSRYEGAPVERLRSATREAFKNLIDLAIEEKVDFIVIAGDLYDGDWKDYNTGLFFANEMARLKKHNIPVYMIKGNHDAASIITKEIKLPDNVYVFDEKKCNSIFIEELGVALHGQGFTSRAVTDNLAKNYPPKASGYFNIGILHTSAVGREGHENYAPCSIEDMKGKEYDYWALGHIHKREFLCEKNPVILFPGNIQSRHSKETGAKGCTLIKVTDGQIENMNHIPLDVLRWEILDIDASLHSEYDQLLLAIEERLEKSLDEAEGRMVAVRIIVTGNTVLYEDLLKNREGFLNNIRAAAFTVGHGQIWIEKLKIKMTAPIDESNQLSDENNPVTAIFNWLETCEMDELVSDVKKELSAIINALPTELKKGDNHVIPDTVSMLEEKLQEVEQLVKLELKMERGNK